MNLATMRSLGLALDEVGSKRARVLVIRGAGDKAFCAGGDLKELEYMRSAEQAAQMARTMRTTLDRLSLLRMPVIAALNGDPLGGGAELAEKAIAEFARTWAAPAHWRAVEKMEKRRRSSKAGR